MILPRKFRPTRHPGAASGASTYLDRDAHLAASLRELIRREGWDVRCSREAGGAWRAEVSCPSLPRAAVGRGGSRLVAISGAHVAALRLLAGSNRLHLRDFETHP